MKTPNKNIRRKILKIIHDSNASHIGTSFSSVEILNAVFKSVDIEKIKKGSNDRDRIILSKGHGTAALYSVMNHHELLSDEILDTYFQNNSLLAGHVSHHVPFVEHSTGALGHGLPVGLGISIGLSSKKILRRVFVILGDGELQEGSNWEAIMLAGYKKIKNLIIFVDYNKLSQTGKLDNFCSLEPIKEKFESFNFDVIEVDGHNENEIISAIKKLEYSKKPIVVICNTIKGKGVSFMENNVLWHYRSPQGEDFEKAVQELKD
jgi:transketolase